MSTPISNQNETDQHRFDAEDVERMIKRVKNNK
jgi:hypothetical protein